ncbi:MAG TPA: glycoside hydrolase family 32 protein [Kineosporiaceae bacterium]|nr:glycoside hydrolase family 32 protein [Kineosporiaceae bacterium]
MTLPAGPHVPRRHQPRFHFTPTRGWMNDPNGLIHIDGLHHLFFQYNPNDTTFSDMHWGHATSTDLITWTEHPIALTPGVPGGYDEDGCWSGCAVALDSGHVAILYSANEGGRQYTALATPVDGELRSWQKSDANPVIRAWPPLTGLTDLRDPSLMREPGGGWRLVLAAGSDVTQGGVPGVGGSVASYLSCGDDLTSWTFGGVLLDGPGAGLPGEVFECPDLFTAPGCADDELVLVLSWYTNGRSPGEPQTSDVIWVSGRLADGRFRPARYGRFDLGDRFYAPQSYATADGRRLQFGWLRTQLDPAAAGRANIGAQSIPRSLSVAAGRLRQEPARELSALVRRGHATLDERSTAVGLPRAETGLEVRVRADTPAAFAATRILLRAADGAVLTVTLAAFATATSWMRDSGTWTPVEPAVREAVILFDTGLVETFADDGRVASTSDLRVEAATHVHLQAPAGVRAEVTALEMP